MVTLAEIASNTAQTHFTWNELDIQFVYYPGLVTEEMFAVLLAFEHMDEHTFVKTFKSLNEMLADMVESWNLYEDKAETIMVPLEAARLGKLPLFFRVKLLHAIVEDIRPEALTPQK